jgi:hypothetical protein
MTFMTNNDISEETSIWRKHLSSGVYALSLLACFGLGFVLGLEYLEYKVAKESLVPIQTSKENFEQEYEPFGNRIHTSDEVSLGGVTYEDGKIVLVIDHAVIRAKPPYISKELGLKVDMVDGVPRLTGISGNYDEDFNEIYLLNAKYRKSSTTVYYQQDILEEADASTFVAFPYKSIYGANDFAYAKDIHNVYCDGQVLFGADPSTFSIIPHSNPQYPYYSDVVEFAVDANNVYQGCTRLNDIDRASFKVLINTTNEGHSAHGAVVKDKNGVYVSNSLAKNSFDKLESIEAASFDVFNGYTGVFADNNNVYCWSRIIEGADPRSFEVLHYSSPLLKGLLAKDHDSIYYGCEKITGVDYSTFEPLFWTQENGMVMFEYAKDKDRIYHFGVDDEWRGLPFYRVIEGANPDTFRYVLENSYIATDDVHEYVFGVRQ